MAAGRGAAMIRSMSVHTHRDTQPTSGNGGGESALAEQLDALAGAYGNRFLLEPAPDNDCRITGCARSTRCG